MTAYTNNLRLLASLIEKYGYVEDVKKFWGL